MEPQAEKIINIASLANENDYAQLVQLQNLLRCLAERKILAKQYIDIGKCPREEMTVFREETYTRIEYYNEKIKIILSL